MWPATTTVTEPVDDGRPPRFSVLIATYNQSRYVAGTLDSVALQTCSDYELVIVDDGSTDATPSVVELWVARFRSGHPNAVTVSRTPNGGQSAALEHGFGLCRGAYVCLLDSDDRWLPHKLAKVLQAATEHPDAGMIVHPLYVIGPDGRRTGDVRPKRASLSAGDVRQQLTATGRHVAPATSGVVIAAAVFRRLIPMPTKRFPSGADAYLTLGASLAAPVCAVAEPLGEYRMHPDGAYLRRMLSAEGIRRSVEMQLAIARHFGLEGVLGRSSFFARNTFARAKLEGTPGEQLARFRDLARASAADRAFGRHERLLLMVFWALCLLSPRWAFARLWRAFQMKQTGYDRIGRAPHV